MDVLKYFPGLIVTQEGDTREISRERKRTLYVRLAHFSIKEYLISDRIFQGCASVFAFTEADAHMHIGRLSLAYHLHISSMTGISDLDEYSNKYKYKLMKYASPNWAEHLEMIPHASWPLEVSRDAVLSFSIYSQSLLIMVRDYPQANDLIRRPYCYTAQRGFRQLTEMLISGSGGVYKYLTQLDLDEGLRYATDGRRKSTVKLFLDKGAQMHDCLEQAAAQGDTAIVGLLLDHGAKINALAGKLESALRAALWNGRLDVLKLLLNRGADVNSPFNKTEYMPKSLIFYRQSSYPADCLRFLLDNGAGVNMKDNNSLAAALYVATCFRFNETFQLLLDRGANMNELAGKDGYLLQAAILHCHDFQSIGRLLDCSADPNAQGGTFNTALQAACATAYLHNIEEMTQVIYLLIDRGADVSIQGGEYGTALQAACRNSVPIAVIKMLLEKGADVNAQGGRYGNALQAACQRNDQDDWLPSKPTRKCQERALEVVQLLLSRGADVHAKGGYYGMALQAACAREYEDIVRLLINRGANVNAQGGRYGTALQVACATGNLEVVHLLLHKGAVVNVEAGYHGTALQAACAKGHIQAARVLLEHGANIHLRNNGAWHAAAHSRDDGLVRLLLDHGVDVNDSHGSHGTALHAPLQRAWNSNLSRMDEDSDGLDLGIECYDFDWTDRIRLLLKCGADPNLSIGEYGTALQTACTVKSYLSRHKSNIYPSAAGPKLLLEICPSINVNAQGGLFGSALQAAAYSGQTSSISLLLNKGAHVNGRGGKYGSALNAAVIAGYWDTVQVLLDAGAMPDCHMLPEPDEEWLRRVLRYDGQGGVERYRKFWEVEKAVKAETEASAN
jgi:ankyrin repeat protein